VNSKILNIRGKYFDSLTGRYISILYPVLIWIVSSTLNISVQAQVPYMIDDATGDTINQVPTYPDVRYGEHPKQVLHFWQAKSDNPTPLAFYIHGGGWVKRDRYRGLSRILKGLLDGGISVVSVEYRFIPEAEADGVIPPVSAPMHDAARALQFVRSNAASWNIDSKHIAVCGESAGACTALWIAFHENMSKPGSNDPVARYSTRVFCAATLVAQTTLDPKQMKEWTPNSNYGSHAFGISGDAQTNAFDMFINQRDKILPWIMEYSPYCLASSDDPPVYLNYLTPPAIGEPQKDPTHTANFGVKLKERLDSLGVGCELVYPGALSVIHESMLSYLLFKLGK